MKQKFQVYEAYSGKEVEKVVEDIFSRFGKVLPQKKDALILVKPNLNSHMNALAGNTTDLRLLAHTIQFLKNEGYSNITIGEGTNSGFYRNNISVISRLRVDALAKHFGVKVRDLNYEQGVSIPFERGKQAEVAKICTEADLFINLPKLKTHFEAAITVCLKNLIGCMVSQANKKKVHDDLPRNILNINKVIRPHIHIIDALIAMEGDGPTRGQPLNYGRIIAGYDPFELDYLCARLMDIPVSSVAFLELAREQKLLNPDSMAFIDNWPGLAQHRRTFKPARGNALTRFIFDHRMQRYFQAIRRTAFFTWLCSTETFGKILFYSGIRQDVFSRQESDVRRLLHDPQKCIQCGTCAAYCPLGRALPESLNHSDEACLQCLYCFLVCPQEAISVDGELGFVNEQIHQFGQRTKAIAAKGKVRGE